MKRKLVVAALLCLALVAVMALAVAPAAFAKSQPVAASGEWTWVGGEDGTDRLLPSGHEFLKGYEIGQWTGTFTATDTYETYVAMATLTDDGLDWVTLAAKLWIHFEDATVNMDGVLLEGDMTMLVIFHAGTWTEGATWKIHNGTGDLKHLGGEGTLVWTETGMDYSGMIWTQK
jgi:hypothetical protein